MRRLSIGRRKKRPQKFEPRTRINFHIRVPEVRVIGPGGEQLGVLATRDAVKQAQEADLDLVEVAPKENPPVCRIMDFGKFLYEEKKKKRESRKKQARVEVKECKFRPKIGEHDFQVRVRRAVKFLAQGNKVKLTVMFRGREHAHPEVAERLILRAYEEIKDLGKLEMQPRKEGRDMHTLVAPLPEPIRKKAMKLREQKAKESGEQDKIPTQEDDMDTEDIGEVEELESEELEDEVEIEDENGDEEEFEDDDDDDDDDELDEDDEDDDIEDDEDDELDDDDD